MHFFLKVHLSKCHLAYYWANCFHFLIGIYFIASRCSTCKLLTSDFDALPEKELEMKLLEDWNALKSELPFFFFF